MLTTSGKETGKKNTAQLYLSSAANKIAEAGVKVETPVDANILKCLNAYYWNIAPEKEPTLRDRPQRKESVWQLKK